MYQILSEIKKKIDTLKSMISTKLDEFVCAGLYTFVIEEFGKLILLRRSQRNKSNKMSIQYAREFTNHEVKFETALDYLQLNGFEDAYILNDYGGFSAKSFSWKGFSIGQLVNLETRLSLFYSDLVLDAKSRNVDISKPPFIDKAFLERAVTTFESAIAKYSIDF